MLQNTHLKVIIKYIKKKKIINFIIIIGISDFKSAVNIISLIDPKHIILVNG